MLPVDLAGAQQKLIDAVRAIVGAGREHISAFEIDDFDDAVVLETDRTGELLAPEPDQTIEQIDRNSSRPPRFLLLLDPHVKLSHATLMHAVHRKDSFPLFFRAR